MDNNKPGEEKEKKFSLFEVKQRIYAGGDFSFSLPSGMTYLYIAPLAGYDIVKQKLSAGLSTMYQFYGIRIGNQYQTWHSYGGGVFLRYRPWKPLLLQTEFDLYNTNNFADGTFERINVPLFLVGAGYARSMGDKAYSQFMLFYDLIQDPNNPLPRIFLNVPIHIKFGFVVYLG